MDAKTYLKTQIKSMWYLQDSVLKDLTDEQLIPMPPGTTSPIGIIWLHLVNGQDNFLSIILEQPSLWKSAGWKERFGLDKAPNMGEDWSKYQAIALSVELLEAYSQAIREHTQTCLDAATDESLDETVKFFSESDPKANVWVLMIGHTLLHCGEIAALKGVLGGKGLPF